MHDLPNGSTKKNDNVAVQNNDGFSALVKAMSLKDRLK